MAREEWAPGAEVAGYTIERTLGRGGMGTVYLARQNSLDRPVALKILHASRLRDPGKVALFLQEARHAARLNHPNLVTVHDVHADAEAGLFCYSMEYVPGITATDLVQRQGGLKRSLALHIAYQVALALAHAHRNQFVHRDVKPDNILVTAGGVAKLLDLGLVRDRIEQVAEPHQRLLTIVGTPEFTAPEQSRNPSQAQPASDVYSLGATLYYCFTGRPPFAGETLIDLIVRTAIEPVTFPRCSPPDCRPLLLSLLAKHPQERPVDGQAASLAIAALAAQSITPSALRTPVRIDVAPPHPPGRPAADAPPAPTAAPLPVARPVADPAVGDRDRLRGLA